MSYSKEEVMQYIGETGVKFIRLAFCDAFGVQKNIAIMPNELERAFTYGISIDASSIPGFRSDVRSDLFLKPDPATLVQLPWRPENGRVVRMFCDLVYPDGSHFDGDARYLLKQVVEEAGRLGYEFSIGTEMEFYIFRNDENGEPTRIPYDRAGYMDVAPDDKGENLRREICLTLEQMGICPESSHHEEGPGQNEIVFRHSDPVTAADNAVTFLSVVKTIAARNGLNADFSPKPLQDMPGNGMHINLSCRKKTQEQDLTATTERQLLEQSMAGIMDRISEISVFLNPDRVSYQRLGNNKAPAYITWSSENRSQLIRFPAPVGGNYRAEIRSADCTSNPYITLALLLASGLEGIREKKKLPEPADLNLSEAPASVLQHFRRLPGSLTEARGIALESEFVKQLLPEKLIRNYCTENQ